MATIEERVETLENNYGMINRTFNMDIVPIIRRMDKVISGFTDERNEFIDGLQQKVEKLVECNSIGKKRFWNIMLVVKDIFVSVSAIFILYQLGIKD